MSETPNKAQAVRAAEYVQRILSERKFALRQAEDELWEKRNDLINQAYPEYGSKPDNWRELRDEIEQYAIAAEAIGTHARLAAENIYRMIESFLSNC